MIDLAEAVNEIRRVAAGAEWLDTVAPGWERKLDLGTLDLKSTTQCVCGQLFMTPVVEMLRLEDSQAKFGSGYGFVLYFAWKADPDNFGAWIASHGFGTGTGDAWVALVKDRFDTGLLSDETLEERG